MEDLDSEDSLDSNEEKLLEMKDNKKPIIIFSKLNKYFLIPFLCPIFI